MLSVGTYILRGVQVSVWQTVRASAAAATQADVIEKVRIICVRTIVTQLHKNYTQVPKNYRRR